MSISIHTDTSNVDRELDRLDRLPGDDPGPLDATLAQVFAQTLAIVHVQTGSLKGSGKTSSETTTGEWVGTIVFGGLSPGGVYDPVRYAGYERARGGDHDFLARAAEFGHAFPEGVRVTLAGPL